MDSHDFHVTFSGSVCFPFLSSAPTLVMCLSWNLILYIERGVVSTTLNTTPPPPSNAVPEDKHTDPVCFNGSNNEHLLNT